MLVNALSRHLEAVAKSVRHATALSTFLAMELLQARPDSAVASSNFFWITEQALRNTTISSQVPFYNKIKEVAISNFEIQQHRFLAFSTTDPLMQPTKPSYASRGSFRKP